MCWLKERMPDKGENVEIRMEIKWFVFWFKKTSLNHKRNVKDWTEGQLNKMEGRLSFSVSAFKLEIMQVRCSVLDLPYRDKPAGYVVLLCLACSTFFCLHWSRWFKTFKLNVGFFAFAQSQWTFLKNLSFNSKTYIPFFKTMLEFRI